MAKKKDTDKEPIEPDGEPSKSLAVNDAWTGMLVVAFLALSVGTGFLELARDIRPAARRVAVQAGDHRNLECILEAAELFQVFITASRIDLAHGQIA